MRVICVDWSGAAVNAAQTIWLAEVRDRTVVRLENGRDRTALIDHLITDIARDPAVIIGFDFAFSFPAWFVTESGCTSAPQMWAHASREGERWLRTCPSPFWGRPGIGRPALPAHFRETDRAIPPVQGIRPKSVFQIGGAGAVGTGSIRGMPLLTRLRDAGCRIWPFDDAIMPVAFEIYPRACTGAVAKRDPSARAAYLLEHFPELALPFRHAAEQSEDAFDALVSALVLRANADSIVGVRARTDDASRLEGAIWIPPVPATPNATLD